MSTFLVWIMIAYIDGSYAGSTVVIDNIASEQNCQALAQVFEAKQWPDGTPKAMCIAVRRVKP